MVHDLSAGGDRSSIAFGNSKWTMAALVAGLPRIAVGGAWPCFVRRIPRASFPALPARRPLHHSQGQQHHAFEAQLAIFAAEPLTLRVRASAIAARADGDSRNSQRERQIGIGRA